MNRSLHKADFPRGSRRGHGRLALAVSLVAFALPFVTVRAQQNEPQQQQASAKQGVALSQPSAKAPAQPPIAPSKIAQRTDIVTVFATVRDKKGRMLSDLSKDQFAISEDGEPQTISYFAREDQLPLTVGLLVDTSMSQRAVLTDERSASATFIDQTLRTDMKDQAFLIHLDHEVELLQDLTTSRQKLDAALNLLQIEQPEDSAGNSGGQNPSQDPNGRAGRGRYHRGGGTHLYDAIFLASDELMKKQPGRKALIILSDGVDRGSMESLASAIEAAQRANTVVYSILFKGEEPSDNFGRRRGGWRMGGPGYGGGPYGGGPYGGQRRYPREEERPDGKKILARISKETGGQLFEVSKKLPVDKIYTQITQQLRDQYVLGYLMPNPGAPGYRKITVTTTGKNQIVQAREGYYAEPQSASRPPSKSGAIY